VSSLVRSALRAIIWATAASLIGTSLCYAGDRGAAKFTASAQDLQRYRISHSLDDLRQSIYDLQGSLFIFDLAPETFVEQRRARIRQWAEILRVIEQSYDPTYDPAVRYWQPSWPLHRPASAAENLQYQKELADFKLRTERTNDYIQLQNVDALAMTSLLMESFALAHYTKMETVSDFEALDGILVRAGISASHAAAGALGSSHASDSGNAHADSTSAHASAVALHRSVLLPILDGRSQLLAGIVALIVIQLPGALEGGLLRGIH